MLRAVKGSLATPFKRVVNEKDLAQAVRELIWIGLGFLCQALVGGRSVAIQGGRTKTQETVPNSLFFPPHRQPNPQETTKQDALEMGLMGLVCPVLVAAW